MNAVKKGSMSMRKPCKEESAELTVGEFVSPPYEQIPTLDNEAPDTYCSVETEPNISYQTVIPAAKGVKTDNATRRIDEKYNKEDVSCKRFICILVTITLVTLISLVCLAVLFIEVSKISQTPSSQNESVFMFQLQQINKSLTSIQDQITTLSREEMENNTAQSNNIQQLNTSIDMQLYTLYNQTQQLSDFSTMLQQQLTSLQKETELLMNHLELGQLPSYPAVSCAALLPSSPSGYYWVRASNGSAVSVYCDMTLSCGGVTGGWMRVFELDMKNSSHQCPGGLMERNDSPNMRTCVRNETSGGCSSVELSTANIQYSRVCGRITAHQFDTVDGFNNADIISHYLDGVSLTHGHRTSAGRQHIWSFAAARSSCSNCDVRARPSSVGDDYFCGVANPMWCTGSDECCTTPYFLKTLPQPTTDDIEMRVCRDGGRSNEDIAIETVEIYVQ